ICLIVEEVGQSVSCTARVPREAANMLFTYTTPCVHVVFLALMAVVRRPELTLTKAILLSSCLKKNRITKKSSRAQKLTESLQIGLTHHASTPKDQPSNKALHLIRKQEYEFLSIIIKHIFSCLTYKVP
ncbi:hypothetical protein L9F63_022308, partial [Diploptera punctata]